MTIESKNIYLISSSFSLIKVAWFVSNKLSISLSQKVMEEQPPITFFEYSSQNVRIVLLPMQYIEIKQLKKFDYLLILENHYIETPQILRDSRYINFITELDISKLSKASIKLLNTLL